MVEEVVGIERRKERKGNDVEIEQEEHTVFCVYVQNKYRGTCTKYTRNNKKNVN